MHIQSLFTYLMLCLSVLATCCALWHWRHLLFPVILVRTIRLMGIGRVDLVTLSKLSDNNSDKALYYLFNKSIADEAMFLCHRGEQLAKIILDVYKDDADARVLKRKLAFMKSRPDLFEKYHRLPCVVYEWELDDPKASQKAAQFKRDWQRIEYAFSILETMEH